MSPAGPLDGPRVSHGAEGVRAAGEKERAGGDQNYILWEKSHVPRPNLQVPPTPRPRRSPPSNGRTFPRTAQATPRPSARGPRNTPPTRLHAGPAAQLPPRSPRPRQAPLGGVPGRALPPRHPTLAPRRPPHPMPSLRCRAPGADPAAAACPRPPPAAPTRLPGLGRHKGKKQHV